MKKVDKLLEQLKQDLTPSEFSDLCHKMNLVILAMMNKVADKQNQK